MGNSNFEKKGDVTNNNLIGSAEYTLDSDHFTVYGRVVGRLDFAYIDDDKYTREQREHAAYNITDAGEFFLEARFGKFTTRWGRHVIQWGENFAAVFTGVNEVSPMALGLVDTAGNPPRSTQVPTFIGWTSFRLTNDISIEGLWQPDFDPRFWFPVAGTFASTSDVIGWGADTSMAGGFILIDDQRPKKFEDMQQYGAAVRVVLPQLNLLELGFYYYHYHNRTPFGIMKMTSVPMRLVFEWPELDMYGMSFNQAFQTILGYNFDWTISGELVWRPRDPITHKSSSKHFQRGDTLAWNIQFWKMISNIMPFTPWNVTFNPMIEFNGKSILEHEESTMKDPNLTANYWVMLDFSTPDMIDNVKLNFTPMIRGGLQAHADATATNNERHAFAFSLGAKYGNIWGVKLGYTLTICEELYETTGSSRADRDAFNFNVTYYW